MSVLYRFTTLEDAYAPLLEVRARRTLAPRSGAYNVVCVLASCFSWVGLEEALDHAIERGNYEPGPDRAARRVRR
jgi:hypothetical protein